MKNKILPAISLGVILQWLSLFLSYRQLPDAFEDVQKPIAAGGFPLKIFEYPAHPMGGGWPPAEMWPAFFLNLGIWCAVGFVLTLLFSKKLDNKKAQAALIATALILTLMGCLYLVLLFD